MQMISQNKHSNQIKSNQIKSNQMGPLQSDDHMLLITLTVITLSGFQWVLCWNIYFFVNILCISNFQSVNFSYFNFDIRFVLLLLNSIFSIKLEPWTKAEQSNCVIQNFTGLSIFVRYNREDSCSKFIIRDQNTFKIWFFTTVIVL